VTQNGKDPEGERKKRGGEAERETQTKKLTGMIEGIQKVSSKGINTIRQAKGGVERARAILLCTECEMYTHDPERGGGWFYPERVSVLDPEKGVCVDPVDEGAILGKGGGEPP
jgi:hypothetical protein